MGQKNWSLKKLAYFLEVNGIIQGVKKNHIVKHHVHFWPFLKAPVEKLMPHPQISFKSWLYNVDPEVYIFLLRSKLWWLEKVSFQTVWASPEPWTKLIVRQRAHFRPFLRYQMKNWCHILKSHIPFLNSFCVKIQANEGKK